MADTKMTFVFTPGMLDLAAENYGYQEMVQEHAPDGTPLTEGGKPKMMRNPVKKADFVYRALYARYLGDLKQGTKKRRLRDRRAEIDAEVDAEFDALVSGTEPIIETG